MEEDNRTLLATSLAHFVNDGLAAALPLMYPVFLAVYELSVQTNSVLIFLQSAISIVASPVIGRRSDARGDFSKMMVLGLVLFAVGTAGYAVSGVFSRGTGFVVLLLLSTGAIAVGSSFYHPLGATMLRAKWKTNELGRVLGLNGSLGSVGRLVLPFAAASLLIAGFTLPYVGLIAAFSLVIAFAAFLILRNVKFTDGKPGPAGGARSRFLPDWNLTRRLFPLTVISFSRGLYTGVQPFLPTYLIIVDHFTYAQAGLLYSAFLGIGIVSQLMFGYMQDRWGPKVSLAVSNIGGVTVLFVFALSSDPLTIETSLVLFGLFGYSAFPLLLGMVQTLTDFEEMTTAGSIVWGVGNSGGSAAAPLLVGALASPILFGNLTAGFVAAALIGIPSVVLIPFVRDRHGVSKLSVSVDAPV